MAAAAVYATLVGGVGLTFNSTPLIIGVAATAAGLVGSRQNLVPIGIALAGWGAAVLLVRSGPLPANREAAVYLVGVAAGLLAAQAVARVWSVPLTGALLSIFSSGVAYYFAYDVHALGDWPLWTVVLAAWGVYEIARPSRVA